MSTFAAKNEFPFMRGMPPAYDPKWVPSTADRYFRKFKATMDAKIQEHEGEFLACAQFAVTANGKIEGCGFRCVKVTGQDASHVTAKGLTGSCRRGNITCGTCSYCHVNNWSEDACARLCQVCNCKFECQGTYTIKSSDGAFMAEYGRKVLAKTLQRTVQISPGSLITPPTQQDVAKSHQATLSAMAHVQVQLPSRHMMTNFPAFSGPSPFDVRASQISSAKQVPRWTEPPLLPSSIPAGIEAQEAAEYLTTVGRLPDQLYSQAKSGMQQRFPQVRLSSPLPVTTRAMGPAGSFVGNPSLNTNALCANCLFPAWWPMPGNARIDISTALLPPMNLSETQIISFKLLRGQPQRVVTLRP
jgi:hypothetical protein